MCPSDKFFVFTVYRERQRISSHLFKRNGPAPWERGATWEQSEGNDRLVFDCLLNAFADNAEPLTRQAKLFQTCVDDRQGLIGEGVVL